LIDTFKHSQDEVAQIVGKSRSHVANTLRLLRLPEPVKVMLSSGKLSAGHARMLIGQPNAETLANEIVSRGLNVRQVEALARDKTTAGRSGKGAAPQKDANTRTLERSLSDALGLTVTIDVKGDGGAVHVAFKDLDQLDEIVRRLGRR
jgi:ParB family chromosome partitioning protein